MLGVAFYAALVAIFVFVTLKKPSTALVAYICMFGIEQLGQLYIPFLRANTAVTNLYILSLNAFAVIYVYSRGELTAGFRIGGFPVRNVSILLMLYSFVTLLWSPAEEAWDLWRFQLPYFTISLIFAPLLINRISDLEDVQKVFIWIGGAIILFFAVVPDWGTRALKVSGTEEEIELPLSLAQLSGYLIITAALYFKKNWISIAGLTIVIVASLIVALRTQSRGQFIFSILTVALITPMVWKRFTFKNAMQLVIICTLMVSVGYYAFDSTVTYSSRWEAEGLIQSANARVEPTRIVLSAWIDSPWAVIFGLGSSASYAPELVGIYPHIVPLEVLAEEGIIGFALLLAVVFLSFRQARRLNAMTFLSQEIRRSYAACFGCFLYTFLLSLKQGSLLISSLIFFFAVVCEKFFFIVRMDLFQSTQQLSAERDASKGQLRDGGDSRSRGKQPV